MQQLGVLSWRSVLALHSTKSAESFYYSISPLLQRVQIIKILGVTFTSSLSVTLHVQSVIAACARTLYALRVLRKHGLCDDSLHDVFRASPSQNSCMHPTPSGDSPTPTTERRSLLSFVAVFALVSVLQI